MKLVDAIWECLRGERIRHKSFDNQDYLHITDNCLLDNLGNPVERDNLERLDRQDADGWALWSKTLHGRQSQEDSSTMDSKYSRMRDPFLFLECHACGDTEGLPCDQPVRDFSVFIATADSNEHSNYRFKCRCGCETVSQDIDEGTEDDDYTYVWFEAGGETLWYHNDDWKKVASIIMDLPVKLLIYYQLDELQRKHVSGTVRPGEHK